MEKQKILCPECRKRKFTCLIIYHGTGDYSLGRLEQNLDLVITKIELTCNNCEHKWYPKNLNKEIVEENLCHCGRRPRYCFNCRPKSRAKQKHCKNIFKKE